MDYYIRLAIGGLKGSIEKQETKMEARRELEVLEAEGELYEKCIEVEETVEGTEKGRRGVCAVWVEKIGVKGPRN